MVKQNKEASEDYSPKKKYVIQPPSADWLTSVKRLYDSAFYSDYVKETWDSTHWSMFWNTCDEYNELKNMERFSSHRYMVIVQQFNSLGITVEARRNFEKLDEITEEKDIVALEVLELDNFVSHDSFIESLKKK